MNRADIADAQLRQSQIEDRRESIVRVQPRAGDGERSQQQRRDADEPSLSSQRNGDAHRAR